MDRGDVAEETCFSGLKYLIIPVQYGGDNLGRIVCGPYMPVDLESPGAEVSEFQGFDAHRLWALGETLRRFPRETVERIGENFHTVVDSLVFTAMKAALTQKLHLESITSSYNDLSRANQELRASVRRLEELDRMKANFLAMVSHELRTPLTSVIGYSEMLIEGMVGPLSDEQLRYCRTIKAKGEEGFEMEFIVSADSLEGAVEAAKTAMDSIRQESKFGVRTILDVLNTQQDMFNAQVSLVNARVTERLTAYRLLASIGRLTAKDLGLDVPIYDPNQHYDKVKYKLIGF
jgi:signal transduction histidine kinase